MVEWTVFLDVIELNADIHRTDTYSNNTFQATDTIFIHADHLNTPRLATSQSQTKVWEWNSDVFGVGLANEDPDNDTNLTKINLRFPGQYFDGESGLHYNYFRDYDPSLGRYIQSDPIGLNGGINTYAYMLSNPLKYVDPDGLRPCPAGMVPPGTPCYLDDGGGSGYPNEGRCATAECAAGLPPNPPSATPEQSCKFKCNMLLGLICGPVAGAAAETGPGIAAAYLACRDAVYVPCAKACNDDDKECPIEE